MITTLASTAVLSRSGKSARPSLRLFGLAAAALALTPYAQGAEQAAPPYPLFGIIGAHRSLHGADGLELSGEAIFSPLRYFRGLYRQDTEFTRQVAKGVKQHALPPKVICYMHGYLSGRNEAGAVERHCPNAIAMADVTVLSADVSAAVTEVRVRVPSNGKLPILASTADVSQNDSRKFCYWIRVDDEVMQVLAVDAQSGLLKVRRGFRSSKDVSHSAGARVLAPVYHKFLPNGSPRNQSVRYVLDPAHEEAQRFKANQTIERLKQGYDGVWLDNFSVTLYEARDALGNRTAPWDFKKGARYARGGKDFGEAMYQLLAGMRRVVKAETGRDPYIAANMWPGNYEIAREILPRAKRPEGLDAFAFEDSFIDPHREKDGRSFQPHELKRWLRHMEEIQQAAKDGVHAIAMTTAAGALAPALNPDYPNYESLDRFGWGSYLLAVTPERSISFGRPVVLWKKNDRLEFVPMGEHYFLPIGDPAEDKEIGQYAVEKTGAYARRFEKAVVFVNPQSRPVTVPLTGPWTDVGRKLGSETLELPRWDARIVMLAE